MHEIESARLADAYGRLDRPGRVLEVGVGTGRFLPMAGGFGHRVFGVDASLEMMGEARRGMETQALAGSSNTSARAVPLAAGAAARLPFASGSFDLVYAIRLLSQTESPTYALATIEEMLRVTATGGWCLIECLSADRLTPSRTSQVRLTVAEMADACRQAGAEVVSVDGRFMIGMTPMRRMPAPLVSVADAVDRSLSRLSASRSSRIYVLARRL